MAKSRLKVVRNPEELEALKKTLKALRDMYGYTQAHVAAELGISRSQYTAIETGRSSLSYDHLCSLAKLYLLPSWPVDGV